MSLVVTAADVESLSNRAALMFDEAGATRKATLTIDDADGAAASLQAATATAGTSMRARATRARDEI